jgi:hypothetical protein
MEMKDSIVEEVRQDLLDRSEVGIKKYNTTLDRDDLTTVEWVQHALEEAMDLSLYLKRLYKDLSEFNTYVLSEDFNKLEIRYDSILDVNNDLAEELVLKNKIIDNLVKVIKSQEDEIAELNKANHYQQKRRNWHY